MKPPGGEERTRKKPVLGYLTVRQSTNDNTAGNINKGIAKPRPLRQQAINKEHGFGIKHDERDQIVRDEHLLTCLSPSEGIDVDCAVPQDKIGV